VFSSHAPAWERAQFLNIYGSTSPKQPQMGIGLSVAVPLV
jgi:hypothetical protein